MWYGLVGLAWSCAVWLHKLDYQVVNTEAAFLPASNKPMLRADVPGFFFHKTISQILMRAVDEGSTRTDFIC